MNRDGSIFLSSIILYMGTGNSYHVVYHLPLHKPDTGMSIFIGCYRKHIIDQCHVYIMIIFYLIQVSYHIHFGKYYMCYEQRN